MKRIRRISNLHIIAFLLFFGLFLFASCEKHSYLVEAVNPGDSISFQQDIQPIFTAKCTTCHKGTRDPDLRAGNSYTSLSAGGYIDPPYLTCKLYTQINSGHATSLSTNERQKILVWISNGASNN